jgi:hypothetical protein
MLPVFSRETIGLQLSAFERIALVEGYDIQHVEFVIFSRVVHYKLKQETIQLS